MPVGSQRKVRRALIRQEREGGHGPVRRAEPHSEAATVVRERDAQNPAMGGQPPAIGARVGNDDPRGHVRGVPAPLAGHVASEPAVPIDLRDESPHLDNLGLDLHDHEQAGGRVPGQQVDRASLSPDGEGDLRCDVPAAGVAQPANHDLTQGVVTGSEDAVELRTPPAQRDLH
jgi:hypothetical protein